MAAHHVGAPENAPAKGWHLYPRAAFTPPSSAPRGGRSVSACALSTTQERRICATPRTRRRPGPRGTVAGAHRLRARHRSSPECPRAGWTAARRGWHLFSGSGTTPTTSTWRDLENDFGGDLLRTHYARGGSPSLSRERGGRRRRYRCALRDRLAGEVAFPSPPRGHQPFLNAAAFCGCPEASYSSTSHSRARSR